MSKKNLFILAAWYVAGGIVASLFNKNKPNEIKKQLAASKESGEGEFSVFVDNFMDTHKNLIDTLKKEVLTDENKAFLESKKQDVLGIIDSYKNDASVLLEELKGKWAGFLTETAENMEKLYNEKKNEISEVKWVAPERLEELKEKLKVAYSELKQDLKNRK